MAAVEEHKPAEKRRALGRGLDSLLPSGPRVVGAANAPAVLPPPVVIPAQGSSAAPAPAPPEVGPELVVRWPNDVELRVEWDRAADRLQVLVGRGVRVRYRALVVRRRSWDRSVPRHLVARESRCHLSRVPAGENRHGPCELVAEIARSRVPIVRLERERLEDRRFGRDG